MDVSEIRKANLQSLIEHYETVEALARAVSTDPTYLVNIKNGVRNMGGRKAREIEDALTLPRGSMDAPNLGKNLPRASGNLTPRENLIADIQRIFRVDKEMAQKGVAMIELMIDKPKASVKKKGRKGAG